MNREEAKKRIEAAERELVAARRALDYCDKTLPRQCAILCNSPYEFLAILERLKSIGYKSPQHWGSFFLPQSAAGDTKRTLYIVDTKICGWDIGHLALNSIPPDAPKITIEMAWEMIEKMDKNK